MDGGEWVPMTIACSNKPEAVGAEYTEADGSTAKAPLLLTKKDTEHNCEATLTVTEAVKQALVQVRFRAITTAEVNGTVFASKPETNSNCHIYLPTVTIGSTKYSGPTLLVK